jgi:hypothetical protein
MKTMDFWVVDKARAFIIENNIDIDSKLRHHADVLHEKL